MLLLLLLLLLLQEHAFRHDMHDRFMAPYRHWFGKDMLQ